MRFCLLRHDVENVGIKSGAFVYSKSIYVCMYVCLFICICNTFMFICFM